MRAGRGIGRDGFPTLVTLGDSHQGYVPSLAGVVVKIGREGVLIVWVLGGPEIHFRAAAAARWWGKIGLTKRRKGPKRKESDES